MKLKILFAIILSSISLGAYAEASFGIMTIPGAYYLKPNAEVSFIGWTKDVNVICHYSRHGGDKNEQPIDELWFNRAETGNYSADSGPVNGTVLAAAPTTTHFIGHKADLNERLPLPYTLNFDNSGNRSVFITCIHGSS